MKHLLVALFASALAALAETIPVAEWNVPAEVRSIDTADIIADSTNVTSISFPDADLVLMDSITFEVYATNGTSVVFDDTYTKILTEKGRRSEATSSVHFNVFYDDVAIIAAEIIKTDGSVVKIDLERNAKVMVDPDSMSSNIYDPNDKILRISYPDLEIGDITRFAFKRIIKKARVPGVWSDYMTLEHTSPIRRYSYFVSAPEKLPVIRKAVRDEIQGTLASRTISTTGSDGLRTLHIWDANDVPQLFPEPDMPPIHTVCQRVLTSTVGSWNELSKWYWGLCKPRLDTTTDEMKKTVEEIIAKSSELEANRIWNIFTWVSQNIRYMGVTTETEAPGYEPHDVSTTFEKRYGVCRDKAALLVAMLRLAGIDAYPVLIHVGEKRDPDVPMTFFNHAIVGVRNKDGNISLMDPTNENSRDLLPAYLAGKSYLIATPEGDPLRTSPEVPASANMVFFDTQATVNREGTISLTSKMEFDGLNDSAYRGSLVRMADEKRKLFLEGMIRGIVAGAKLDSYEIKPADLRDTETPLSIVIKATATDFPAEGTGGVLLDLPWMSSQVGYVNFVLGSVGLDERRFPLETGDACGIDESVTVKFESLGNAIALPDDVSFRTNGITYSRKTTCENHTIKSSKRLELNLTSYPADIYKAFKETLHEIEKSSNQNVIVEKGPSPLDEKADVRILSNQITYDVIDSSSWTTTVTSAREILTYSGRKSNSEIKIPFNPAWEEVELLYATVSNANGQVQSVRKEEINVMDQGWVASAPRYPAAKTMVISLPGVEIGSVIRTSYRFVCTKRPFFSFSHAFQGTQPIDKDVIVINSGDDIHINYAIFNGNGLEQSVVTNGHVESFTITANSPATLPKEDHLPPARYFAKSIVASSGNWQDYSDAICHLAKSAISPESSAKTRAKARELCSGIDSQAEQVVAIRDFVVKNIRVAGPDFTDIPLQVTPVDETLEDGYGNKLDRAAVLLAMLQENGVDCRIVLADPIGDPTSHINTNDKVSRYSYASPAVFTLPLIEILTDQKLISIYLGDTDQYAELGVSGMDGKTSLPIDSDNDDGLSLILVGARYGDRIMVYTDVELDAAGNASVSITNFYYGTSAASIKKSYSEYTPELRSRHFQELIGAISVAAKPVGDLFVDIDNYPHIVGYTAYAPDYASRTGDTMSVPLPGPSGGFHLRSESRKLPILIPKETDLDSLTIITLPYETSDILIAPDNLDFDYTKFDLGMNLTDYYDLKPQNGKKSLAIISKRQGHPSAVVGPEFNKSILEINRQMSKPERKTLVIKLSK